MLRWMLRGGNAVLSGNGRDGEGMRATLGARMLLRALLRRGVGWLGRRGKKWDILAILFGTGFAVMGSHDVSACKLARKVFLAHTGRR